MQEQRRGGAQAGLRRTAPAIDLAEIVALLGEAVAQTEAHPQTPRWLILDPATGSLAVKTQNLMKWFRGSAPLARLVQGADGFLRNCPPLSPGMVLKLGGRIAEGSEPRLAREAKKLCDALADALGAFEGPGFRLSDLVVTDADVAFRSLGRNVGGVPDKLDAVTSTQPMRFSRAGKADERKNDIARVVSAVEEIEGGQDQWAEMLLQSFKARLLRDGGAEEEEIDDCLDRFRTDASTEGKQFHSFLNFLQDEAASRIRLAVGLRLMRAVSRKAEEKAKGTQRDSEKEKYQELADYVERVRRLHRELTSPDSEADVEIDASSHYGSQSRLLLSEELRKALFYNCLPVWTEAKAQLFETKVPAPDTRTLREVSHRFRINGIDPETRLSAFESRLNRIEKALLETPEPTWVKRKLAELVFLSVVTAPASDVLDEARKTAAAIRKSARTAVRECIDSLRGRAQTMKRIAATLVELLRESGPFLAEQMQDSALVFHLRILPSILDQKTALLEGGALLKTGSNGDDQAVWLEHLTVSEKPDPGSLLSIKFRIRLAEGRLVALGDAAQARLQREYPARLLQVLLRSTQCREESRRWSFARNLTVEYDPRILEPGANADAEPPDAYEAKLAVYRTAFAVLAHVLLSVLLRRIQSSAPDAPSPTLLLFRFQGSGRNDSAPLSADQFVYAASQALEHALGLAGPAYGQGLIAGESGLSHREKSAFNAIYAAFPLFVECRTPALDRVGVLSFASRPCDGLGGVADEREARHVFVGKAYLAEATVKDGRNGFRVQVRRHLLETAEGADAFEKPPGLLEAIRDLAGQGCASIVFLSHRYGGRHIGRGELRHRHHENPAFLRLVAKVFPDLTFYPIVREIFTATRLREKDADAYEIHGFSDHAAAATEARTEGLYPFFTLATLRVVGSGQTAAHRPQSSFATYFYLEDNPEIEMVEWRKRASSKIFADPPDVREDLGVVLRSLHYLECEMAASRNPAGGPPRISPTLDPFAWLDPDSVGGIGEMFVRRRNSRLRGEIHLNLPAVLARMHSVIDAFPERNPHDV